MCVNIDAEGREVYSAPPPTQTHDLLDQGFLNYKIDIFLLFLYILTLGNRIKGVSRK